MASSNAIKALPENIGDYVGLQALMLQVGGGRGGEGGVGSLGRGGRNAVSSRPHAIAHLIASPPPSVLLMCAGQHDRDPPALHLAPHPFPPSPLLCAQGNTIAALPPSISRLTALKALSLADNKLAGAQALPDAVLGACTSLRMLDVSGNALTALPRCLGTSLPLLKTLKAAGNKLAVVPEELAQVWIKVWMRKVEGRLLRLSIAEWRHTCVCVPMEVLHQTSPYFRYSSPSASLCLSEAVLCNSPEDLLGNVCY